MSGLFVTTAPLSPNVPRFFWMIKLVEAASLSSAILKRLPCAPIACALSSITLSLCFWAIFWIATISAHCPYKWTGMMALVLGVIAASILEASIHLVMGSQSTNTALAPAIQIASAVAKNVLG